MRAFSIVNKIVFVFCLLGIFYYLIIDSKLYARYKYGMQYNTERVINGLIPLPETFSYELDDFYINSIVWNAAKETSSKEGVYLHTQKRSHVNMGRLLVEVDIFKLTDSTGETIEELSINYNFSESDNNEITNQRIIKETSLSNKRIIDTLYDGQYSGGNMLREKILEIN